MKRRVSRDISIFNLSMLDVICSALGAIVILFILSNQARTEAVGDLKKADATVSAVKANQMKARAELNAKYLSKIHQLEEKVEQLKDKVAVLSKGARDKASLKKRLAKLQSDMKNTKRDWRDKRAMQRRLAQLQQQIEQLKKRKRSSGVTGRKRYLLWFGGGGATITGANETSRGWMIKYKCKPASGRVCKGCGGTSMRRGGTVVGR